MLGRLGASGHALSLLTPLPCTLRSQLPATPLDSTQSALPFGRSVFRPTQRTDAERARERRLHANNSEEIEDEARDEPGEDADADDDEGQDFDEDEDEEEADAEDDDLSAYLASLPEEELVS